jgi:hypothetical protein
MEKADARPSNVLLIFAEREFRTCGGRRLNEYGFCFDR